MEIEAKKNYSRTTHDWAIVDGILAVNASRQYGISIRLVGGEDGGVEKLAAAIASLGGEEAVWDAVRAACAAANDADEARREEALSADDRAGDEHDAHVARVHDAMTLGGRSE